MDQRDKYIAKHQRIRQSLDAKFPISRLIKDADHQMKIARSNNRIALFMALALWKESLIKQL
ncbi:MAG TPA: hypothetical protein DCF62_03105 [Porticoccaceae bacterium]|nr:hypothetical protein [Porticoccaceae bacterium]